MLEYMRKNSSSVIVWLIIGAIAVVFIFFGIGGGGGSIKSIMVNGEEIPLYEYNRLMDTASRNRGVNDDSPEAQKAIKNLVVHTLVTGVLASQFGVNTGLAPTNQAVADYMASTPDFQVDGQFSRAAYDSYLKSSRQSAAKYENEKRRDILFGRISGLIQSLSRVQDPEAMEVFHFERDKVRLDYLFFPSAPHRHELNPTDDQLTAFYAFNQENWRQPATMAIEYVDIRPVDFLEKVTVPEEELLDRYNEAAHQFPSPESADVSQIVFKFPDLNPREEVKKAVFDKALAAYERSLTENFAALARELSEDPESAAMGGTMPTQYRSASPDSLEEAAFNLPVGQVSQPLETNAGYHLLKVNERRPAGVRPLAEVRETLEGELKAFKAREMAVTLLEDLIVRTETNPKLADAAASMGLTVKTSDSFTQDSPPEFFENDPQAVQRAFTSPLGRVAAAVEKNDHLTVFTPLTRQESRIPPLDEVRESVTQAWISQEAGRQTKVEAQEFIKKAVEAGWDQARASLAGDRASSGTSELAPRTALIGTGPFSGAQPLEMLASLFSMAKASEVSPLPVFGINADGEAGCFVLAMAEFAKADEAEFNGPEAWQLKYQLATTKANLMYMIWQKELHEISNKGIKVPPMYLE